MMIKYEYEEVTTSLFNAIVCSNDPDGHRVALMFEKENPSGTSSGWCFLDEVPDYVPEEKKEGMQPIVNCAEKTGYKHYLLYT